MEGIVTPDTVPPVLSAQVIPPDTVSVDDTLVFGVTATDNDTLSDVRLHIAELFGDTLHCPMAGGPNHSYHYTWVVPDTGYYNYWFEAEDFWENVGVLPDSGTFHFVTEGWSEVESAIPHPSSFLLSIFPNPFNSQSTLSLTVPRAERVRVVLYDLLGREAQTLADDILTPGEHRIVISGSELPSGVYFLSVQSPSHRLIQKLLLLK
jgi:hypothetical protein